MLQNFVAGAGIFLPQPPRRLPPKPGTFAFFFLNYCKTQKFPSIPLLTNSLRSFVAGAGIEPASGDYEPPEVTVPPPRRDAPNFQKISAKKKMGIMSLLSLLRDNRFSTPPRYSDFIRRSRRNKKL